MCSLYVLEIPDASGGMFLDESMKVAKIGGNKNTKEKNNTPLNALIPNRYIAMISINSMQVNSLSLFSI